MKDQVEVLRRKGVKAANLDSTLGVNESIAVKESVRTGDLKILYVAPERFVFCFNRLFHRMNLFTGSTMKVSLR